MILPSSHSLGAARTYAPHAMGTARHRNAGRKVRNGLFYETEGGEVIHNQSAGGEKNSGKTSR
ncbi:hypothetical protein CHK_3055 [Christensenella hongkongensis]|uniref:Uncharacterized protein n=1 Tax=Christensenella hongkongensis TaxID=270498 RepID=A0A0M2NGA9_9FIRM|nr:hypothetical protein CHK_3055 [Christensenella hongkongensis]